MSLLLGSLLLRPYVFAFLITFLVTAGRDLGGRRTALFGGWVWLVAFVAEFSSTRNGVPFGLYHYTGDTRGHELFIANVPFFDSLSFVFLAYASLCLARAVLAGAPSVGPVALAMTSGVLMMLLDVVIDPVAVRGDRWFLGRIFWYPEGGVYFGVPLSNFVGWVVVGVIGVGGYLMASGHANGRAPGPGAALYYAVLVFNLVVTAWIGEWSLLLSGVAIHLILAMVLWTTSRTLARGSRAGFTRAVTGGGFERGA